MQVKVYKDYDEMSKSTAEYIAEFLNEKPDALLCLPAGDTPEGAFRYLVRYHNEKKADFSRCKFVGLDEWVGIDENNSGSCKYFMYKNLFEPLSIREANIVFFDACSKDLEAECKRADDFILMNGHIDLMLVGVGMNGHIALNEPGTPFDMYAHVVELDPVTRSVGQKYFKEKAELEKGITLGLRHLTDAGTAILTASGSKKAGVIKKVIEGPVSTDVPASIIQRHRNSLVLLDDDAAAELK